MITSMISYILLTLIIMASLGYTPFIVVTVGGVKYRNNYLKFITSSCCVYLLPRREWSVFNHNAVWYQGSRGTTSSIAVLMFRHCIVHAVEDKACHSHSPHCYCPYYINWYKKPPEMCIILPRMPGEGCIGSLIQQLGYVNKQFALQRDDMTKELWRQNWISFDRMWLPLRLIDFHHRHIVEAFTTWNWEESAPIERKWQSNTNNGVS